MQRAESSSRGRRESLADRIASRSRSLPGRRASSPGVRPTSSTSQGQAGRPVFQRADPQGDLSHEGWLNKRSSGKISGRWQRRYFRLEGCFLRYMQTPDSAVKKSFDMRKVQSLSVVEQQELELDFGFRAWRLRSSNAAAARRWLVLLEAAQLLGGTGDAGEIDAGEGSDDDGNTCSNQSVTTAASMTSDPGTPKFGAKAREQTPCIIEQLEVDARQLDNQFRTWLPFLVAEDSFADRSAGAVIDGMSAALQHMWKSLCGTITEVPEALTGNKAVEALTLLLEGRNDVSPVVARQSLENFVGEFLLHTRHALESWLEMTDPPAEELGQVAHFVLFEARPGIMHFCDGAEDFAGEALDNCKAVYNSLEKLLMREWESRSCEEASVLFAEIFSSYQAPTDLTLGLRRLSTAASAWRRWRGHAGACERAASVLIATLNAALRSHKIASQPLLQEASQRCARKRRTLRQALSDLQKAGTCADTKPASAISSELLQTALQDAARLGTFCRSASAEPGYWASVATTMLCAEVLASFASAFEAEASSLAGALVSVHARKHSVRVPGFRHKFEEGILTQSVRDWSRFLDDLPSPSLRPQCSRSVVEQLARAWIETFIREPPRSSGALLSVIRADEAAMTALVSGEEGSELAKFLEVLQALRAFIDVSVEKCTPSWEDLARTEARLQQTLDEDVGRAMAQAMWQVVKSK
mmetsp:Transcript_46944/g.87752  ORF Transcript_46944/g.87752 Transcript_46944/m.87752 type:complete len:700 (+) Transcript_46944:37-2136(+)